MQHAHHVAAPDKAHDGTHHEHMAEDFRRRFWIAAILTLPVLALSPLIQKALGLEQVLEFQGDLYVLFGLSTAVYFYGGWPFLTGLWHEVTARNPGMMTLIGVAITVAYGYSAAIVFGLTGKMFFWELVTLIDIMLFGHWIEMRSVMGAGRALEQLASLMPDTAHRLMVDGSTVDVPVADLRSGDQPVVKSCNVEGGSFLCAVLHPCTMGAVLAEFRS